MIIKILKEKGLMKISRLLRIKKVEDDKENYVTETPNNDKKNEKVATNGLQINQKKHLIHHQQIVQ